METCICCGIERRMDRMSLHILDKHKDNLINVKLNKKYLETAIKEKKGIVRIYLTSSTNVKNTKCYLVSFGYNSGWTCEPKMSKVLDKIKEHREEHLKICKELLEEIEANILKTGDNTIHEDSSEAYNNLKEKYNDLLKNFTKMEKDYKNVKKNLDEIEDEHLEINNVYKDTIKCIGRLYNITEDETWDIQQQVSDIYSEYKGKNDDESWAELSKEISKVQKYNF
jgi:transposase-like protein